MMQEELINKMQSELFSKREGIIKNAIEDSFLMVDFSKMKLVTSEADKFEHLFYTHNGEQIKIVSIAKTPVISYSRDEDKNNITVSISLDYY